MKNKANDFFSQFLHLDYSKTKKDPYKVTCEECFYEIEQYYMLGSLIICEDCKTALINREKLLEAEKEFNS